MSEAVESEAFSLTLGQLEAKIRELFHLSPTASLVITYVDKENDVVTLGDDHDLVDACLLQRLNPLHLDVRVLESKPEASARTPENSPISEDHGTMETLLKALFPQVPTDAVEDFLCTYAQLVDPKLPAETLFQKAQDAFKEFLDSWASLNQDKPNSSDKAAHHCPYKKSFAGMSSTSMPTAAKDGLHHPVLHVGVECDSCGMTPIEGSRYKSTKMLDYDLCSTCFEAKGNETDYQKLEHPAYLPPFLPPFRGHYGPPSRRRGPRPFMGPPTCNTSFAHAPHGWKPEHAFGGQPLNRCPPGKEHKKLDARFVKDVTIFDGTELAPGTKFTKIWRMTNIGTLPWPPSTQMVHMGGDALSTEEVVNLELSEDGLQCGEDVEVSVDLTAPDKTGRYISHWRLKSPSGQTFGQRVWAMIQVVPQGEQSPLLQESLKEGENYIDAVNGPIAGLVHSVPAAEIEKGLSRSDQSELEKSNTNHHVTATEGLAARSYGTGEAGSGLTREEKVAEFSDMKHEVDGFSLVEKPAESREQFSISDQSLVESEDSGNTFGVKEKMEESVVKNTVKTSQELKLQSLESMGFTNLDLNAFLLDKNNESMQLTLDDLLVDAAWNGALQDLEDMGFNDQSTNTRLLLKNKGSINGAVKDLVKLKKQKAEGYKQNLKEAEG